MLAKAKKDYPIGTIFTCPSDHSEYLLKSHKFDSSFFLSNIGEGFIYNKLKGRWATVVSYPKGHKMRNQITLGNGDIISKGTIIVSLIEVSPYRKIGDVFRVGRIYDSSSIYYLEDISSRKYSSWRLATLPEITNFNIGIKNVTSTPSAKKDTMGDKPMTKNQILTLAKKMYPEGTLHSGAGGSSIAGAPVPDDITRKFKFVVEGELKWSSDNIYSRAGGAIYVESNIGREWAFTREAVVDENRGGTGIMEQIVSKPKQKMGSIQIANIITSKKSKKRRLIN